MACLNPISVYCSNVNEAARCSEVGNEVKCNAGLLRDLIDMRDGMKECDLLSTDEIGQMIYFLCIS